MHKKIHWQTKLLCFGNWNQHKKFTDKQNCYIFETEMNIKNSLTNKIAMFWKLKSTSKIHGQTKLLCFECKYVQQELCYDIGHKVWDDMRNEK